MSEDSTPKVVTDIDESITEMGGNKTETVIRDLLTKKHLPFISETSFEQVVEIAKLKHIAKKYGKDNFPKLNETYPIEDSINEFIENFLLYMCSYKRERVKEFLDGLKAERDNIERKPMGMWSKMLGK